MNKYLHNDFSIYLFEKPSIEGIEHRPMINEFIQFIKSQKVKSPFKFSYVGKTNAFFSELSLIDNILIDFHGTSLTLDKKEQFYDILKLKENLALKELFMSIENPHIEVENANAEMKKIGSLIKSLISESEFILLDCPEEDLSEKNQHLFFNALKFHVENFDKNVLMTTLNKEFIYQYISYVVTRNDKNEFVVSKLNYKDQFKIERDKFYKQKDEPSILEIKIPTKKHA